MHEFRVYCKETSVPSPPLAGFIKFNMGRVDRGKPGPQGIAGVLLNEEGEVWCMFSKHVGVKYSNEAVVLAILEVLICILWVPMIV